MKIREIESILLEDRSDYIKQQKQFVDSITNAVEADRNYKGPTDIDAILNQLKTADPLNGANIVWIARMYANGQFKLEDLGRIKSYLSSFFKNRAKIQNKDLNSYKNLDQLYDVVNALSSSEDSTGVQSDVLKQFTTIPDVEVVINSPNFVVVVPKTYQASRKLVEIGLTPAQVENSWCTRNSNMFKQYSAQGPLYVIATVQGGKLQKWQFHVESDQYKNVRDTDISKQDISLLSSIPEYTKFLNYLIKVHYGKYFKA